jgi:beta-lactam-binding protein with PASTA domain/tRNA A-37 threonylcarbamoyl transferase component Bud32
LYVVAAPHLAEQVGRVLDGRYRVVAPIGTGASAAVYLADDTTLRRRVALKVLHAALAGDQGFLKRFQAEAHVAAALSHPNIMRVIDWGESDETGPFLVLEYLGGGSLRSLLDQSGALTPEQTTHVGLQAARALDYAHRRGLVHRDIKPANLLFDDEGRIAIADFGLARALAEAAWTEPGGAMLGTARYASPEQVRGHALDGKADVYSLGLVLFEMATGNVPFTSDTTIAMLMSRLDKVVDVPEDVFGDLTPVVQAALDPDPENRIDAAQLVKQLEAVAADLPSPEHLRLPGAVVIDVRERHDVDPTMLPGVGEPAPVSVEARPLPPELAPKRRRVLRRKNKEARFADGAASKRRRLPRLPLPSWKQVIATVIVAALLAAGGAGGWLLYYKTGREITVPPLAALNIDAARLAAEQSDVKIQLDEVFNETIPAGETFEQSPLPGATVHPREVVRVKVSRGPAPRPVDNVVGQQINDVRKQFEDKGFKVTTEDRHDEVAPVGKIFEQTPAEGLLDKGGEVKFVISSGPKPRIVPSVVGKSKDDALAAISSQQLKANIVEEFSDNVSAGQVAGTRPSAGSSAARDSTVTLIISKGPNLVTVPNVAGRSVSSATSLLANLGLEVTEVRGRPDRPVFDTDPVAGTRVKKGTSIALYTR